MDELNGQYIQHCLQEYHAMREFIIGKGEDGNTGDACLKLALYIESIFDITLKDEELSWDFLCAIDKVEMLILEKNPVK